jgi:hypothetical protein
LMLPWVWRRCNREAGRDHGCRRGSEPQELWPWALLEWEALLRSAAGAFSRNSRGRGLVLVCGAELPADPRSLGFGEFLAKRLFLECLELLLASAMATRSACFLCWSLAVLRWGLSLGRCLGFSLGRCLASRWAAAGPLAGPLPGPLPPPEGLWCWTSRCASAWRSAWCSAAFAWRSAGAEPCFRSA